MDEYRPKHLPLFSAPAGARHRGSGLTRVRHGIYAPAELMPTTAREAMHFVRMQAEAMPMRDEPVFSHWSAAVAWGIPVVGPLPSRAHMVAAGSVGRRTQRGIVWHNDHVEESEITRVGGVRVTSLRRTLLDLARVLPFASAVAAVDFGIRPKVVTPWGESVRGVDHAVLQAHAEESAGLRGIRSARTAVGFADARSGSPGESVSRANMHLLGIPAPELQVAFARSDGGCDIVDFDWPELGRFGEFDGRGKYFRDEFTNGRSPEEVLWDEKLREDRIRRHRPIGARWDWSVAVRPAALAVRLAEFGIHPTRRRREAHDVHEVREVRRVMTKRAEW